MQSALLLLQIIFSLSLTIMILVQTRGTGFGRAFGGGGSSASFTRRGLERVVFRTTFIVSGLFLIISILSLSI
ncbi:preprotein translocase subunit SecG [Candidatus Woesebacteria bacterium RIFCSPHIGHO2_01_FULL_39_32]|uniref:Protein-export membrane protein SecG n=1 Tax=Candidatus Woesebacteria bacterium RIFCSPLOWO2_01_FULL_39_25 TaxID=1802521 RepID=A0A1F8BN81_9BACT|nr:MAG: preprotein translocase subunit SecG [Candidatus Woesebacteria bacterium GWB1_37_5]OGM25578.1 MAG: preprotein translocase subunit SecG [Candidatus Woesebacteria bacterium RIFCSPHIGHO2_01_FULL_39_32]OGM36857.1 MAG: preprotein translocase subunit SecG [Candidatus Woesebacteria bacterium RIFCSPHIGHO2_12_FULL_38_11]OGM65109.1 MAG: preprotein translocase subunit SecG [Candidatus Woesebacteria bacterium RIFCSPLOWO2_01_FULL_39_25]